MLKWLILPWRRRISIHAAYLTPLWETAAQIRIQKYMSPPKNKIYGSVSVCSFSGDILVDGLWLIVFNSDDMKVRLEYELYEHETLTEQMFMRQGINKALGNRHMDMTQLDLSMPEGLFNTFHHFLFFCCFWCCYCSAFVGQFHSKMLSDVISALE